MDTTTHTHSRLGRLGRAMARRRRTVVVAWLVALVAVIGGGGALAGEFSVDYATPGSESQRAQQLVQERFPGRSEDGIDLVWQARAGERALDARGEIAPILREAGRLDGIAPRSTRGSPEVSPDGRTAVMRLALDRRTDQVPPETGERIVDLAKAASKDGLTVAVGGAGVPGVEEEGGAHTAEIVGLGVAAIVLLMTFGTFVAAGLPIALALFGLGISGTAVGVLASVMDVADWAPQVGAMLGLGVGIDYALLILTRHRAALARGASVEDAVGEAMATAGHSVLVAGGTVVISLLGLFLMRLDYLYGVALAAVLSVLVVLAASVTLLPALLGLLGRRVGRLKVPFTGRGRDRDASTLPAARWARAVQRRPVVATVAAVGVLLALAAPATGLRFGFPDAGNDREGTTTRIAYDTLAEGFGPGANGPLVAVAETADRGAAQRIAADLREAPGVASVASPRQSPDGSTALIAIQPSTAPQDARTADLIERLREGPLARADVPVSLGGATAATVDQGEATAQRLPLFIGAVVLLSFLLLVAAFRAPVVALKAGVMTLLSIGAAYGAVALFAGGGPVGELVGIDTDTPIPPFIPVMMFAIVFGLSMDYEVFLLGRVREELDRHGDPQRAVVDAVASTARVITAAAAIMVAVFAAFALSPEVFLKLIGLGLATAILVDATIVRMVLVPAVMALLGRRAWWSPRWLAGRRQDRSIGRTPSAQPA